MYLLNLVEPQLFLLRCLFLCFEAMSGLKINLSKSEILPVGDVGFVADEVFGSSFWRSV